jgi:hypothetical protein
MFLTFIFMPKSRISSQGIQSSHVASGVDHHSAPLVGLCGVILPDRNNVQRCICNHVQFNFLDVATELRVRGRIVGVEILRAVEVVSC